MEGDELLSACQTRRAGTGLMRMLPTVLGSKAGTGQPHDVDSMSLAQLPARLQLHLIRFSSTRSKAVVNRSKAVVSSSSKASSRVLDPMRLSGAF